MFILGLLYIYIYILLGFFVLYLDNNKDVAVKDFFRRRILLGSITKPSCFLFLCSLFCIDHYNLLCYILILTILTKIVEEKKNINKKKKTL